MSDRHFPIRTTTSCQLKWNWSTLYLYSGVTASCHRTGWGKVTPDTFEFFHNTEKKQQDRQAMLNGQWPTDSCKYCQDIEAVGGFSDRMLHLDTPDQSPFELDHNPIATVVNPRILEVYFNNTCNLSCLYCLPQLSSKINQENQMNGKFDHNGVVLDTFEKSSQHSAMIEKFWEWMHKNSQGLARLNVAGGEAFYQTEFDKCLEYFGDTQHKNLELGIVTNLMVPKAKLVQYVEQLKQLLVKRKLKRVDITCSIDCMGPEQEYVRYGINLDTWFKNFEYLLSQRWLTININQTISVLTIKTMPALIEHLKTWREQRLVGHYFSEVSPQPSYLSPNILGGQVFAKDFDQILSLIPESSALKYMQGISQRINASVKNNTEAKKLLTFLDEKDRRRGTSWRDTFPWLEKELINVV